MFPRPSFALKCCPPPAGEKMFLELSPLSVSVLPLPPSEEETGGEDQFSVAPPPPPGQW